MLHTVHKSKLKTKQIDLFIIYAISKDVRKNEKYDFMPYSDRSCVFKHSVSMFDINYKIQKSIPVNGQRK